MVAKFREILTATPRRRTLTLFIGVFLLFTLITWFYMGRALTSCTTQMLTNAPGDGTAGLTWLTWVDDHHGGGPIPGITHLTNAPFGESLRIPFQITSAFSIPSMWLLGKLTDPVCSWNLMVYLGYMSSALAMFAFLRWLTRNPWVAFFAGFAVAYTPYHQLNAFGHLSYMFSYIFALFLWAFVLFWRRPTVIRAGLMAATAAVGFYMDGYFILLSSVLAAFTLLGAFVSDFFIFKHSADYRLTRLKGIAIYGIITLALLTPIFYVQHKYSSAINTNLSSSRNDITDEAQTYSTRPYEFLLPAANTPLLPASYGTFRVSPGVLHNSNLTESTVYAGIVVLALACYFLVWLIRYRYRPTELRGQSLSFLTIVFLFALLGAFLISLPPHSTIWGHRLDLPSDVIIHITALWRVFARLYVVIETCLVVLAALGLWALIRTRPPKRQALITVGAVILVGLDFLTQSRAYTWSYSEVPNVYKWLSTQPSIHLIAEYPIGEPPSSSISDYLTYQQVSDKAMINTSRSDSPQHWFHLSIEGLADAQTLPVLRALGVQLVLSHRQPAKNIAGLSLLRVDNAHFDSDGQPYDTVWTYRLAPGPVATYAVVAAQGFHDPIVSNSNHSTIVMGSLGVLNLQALSSSHATSVPVSLTADSINGNKLVTVSQNGVVLWQGQVAHGTKMHFTAATNLPIDIIPYHPTLSESLQIYDFQAGS